MREVQLGILKPEYLQRASALAKDYDFHRKQGLTAHRRAQDASPERRREFMDSASYHLGKALSIGSKLNSEPLKPSDGGRMKIKKQNTNAEMS
jgi:hypothetical protein